MRTYGMWVLCVAVGITAAAIVLAVAPSAAMAAKIRVAPPPPPPPADAKAPAAFDYEHTLKKVNRERKPVVALLRVGDIVELKEYLPFGRTVMANRIEVDGSRTPTIVQGGADAAVRLPPAIRAYLVRELLDTKEFIVIERERIVEIAREIALAKTQAVNPETTVRPSQLIGVHYIIEGAYFGIGGLPPDDPALEGVKKDLAKRRSNLDPSLACTMYLTVYKVETGEVKAVACGAGLRPLVAVKKAVEDLVDQLGDVVEPIKVARVNAEKGLALLDIGSDSGTKVGDVFTLGAAAGAAGEGPKAPINATVTEVQPLSCVVSVPNENKAAVKENMQVHLPIPPAETPAPAPPALK